MVFDCREIKVFKSHISLKRVCVVLLEQGYNNTHKVGLGFLILSEIGVLDLGPEVRDLLGLSDQAKLLTLLPQKLYKLNETYLVKYFDSVRSVGRCELHASVF